MGRLTTVLFAHRGLVSFVKNDYDILSRHFLVHPVKVSKNLLKSTIDFIRFTPTCDIVFVWFAGYQALLSVLFAKLFRKKIVVVAGGYDAAYVPEIHYGAFVFWYRAAVAYFVFKKSDAVVAVSESTKKELLQRVTPKRVLVIYNGIDVELFSPKGRKERLVSTVAVINSSNIVKKGLEAFVKAAAYLPETTFVVVGPYDGSIDILRKIAGKNVKFTGQIPLEKLLDFYRKCKVYVQVSYREEFGVALAEAMACECVPVVTRTTALPEVVGDCGFYVPYGQPEATARAIDKAMNDLELGRRARERIVNMFALSGREQKLLVLLKALAVDEESC
jgi:glycosyltransferase involved in cell wall biosynthesis